MSVQNVNPGGTLFMYLPVHLLLHCLYKEKSNIVVIIVEASRSNGHPMLLCPIFPNDLCTPCKNQLKSTEMVVATLFKSLPSGPWICYTAFLGCMFENYGQTYSLMNTFIMSDTYYIFHSVHEIKIP